MIRPLIAVFVSVLCCVALAQDKNQAVTDPAQADADFAYQGEYAAGGWGLQVVASGNGKFDAVLYPGGLPGAGWTKREPVKLKGARWPDVVTLDGDDRAINVYPAQAEMKDASGRVVAQLAKQNRVSPTMGQQPPAGAVVLFNGTSADNFQKGKLSDDGHLWMGTMTKDKVGDFRLHLEFRLPYMPHARGQGRANSGVYIQQRYEVQILDSFGLEGANNECGAIYTEKPPDVNMALPPLAWQTYDIWFRQPRWSADGKKTKIEPAKITVLHNGVVVQWQYSITDKTGGGKPEGPEEFPIALQDHGNPVVFRNIWLVPGLGEYPVQVAATACIPFTAARGCEPRRGLLRRLLRRCG